MTLQGEGPPRPPNAPLTIHRPDLYVVARFLEALWQPDVEYSRSQLQMAVRVNYDLFRRYLAFMEAKGFVIVAENAKGVAIVRITPRGREAHGELVHWIRRVLGDSVL